MILPSRKKFRDADDFVEQFLATLYPFSNFLSYKNFSQFAYPDSNALKILKQADAETFFDMVISSEKPYETINLAFRLIGLPEWQWKFEQNSEAISTLKRLVNIKDKKTTRLVCDFLVEYGLFELIESHNIDEILLGIYLSKRNIFLEMFPQHDLYKLQLIDWLEEEFREYPVTIKRDVTFYNRKFDCSLKLSKRRKFVFNFDYCQVSSPHPVRVSREYGLLQYQLLQQNITIIWVTDGDGYHTMKKCLRRAYEILPNIYNTKQFKRHFRTDVRVYLNP